MYITTAKQLLHNAHMLFLLFLEVYQKKNSQEFVEKLGSTGLLANFELMLPDDQHVVDYSLADPKLAFLALTGRRIQNEFYLKNYGKTFPVPVGIVWAKSLGVPITDMTVYPYSIDGLQHIIHQIRQESNSEGAVLYFLDKNLRNFGMCKIKSTWYIILRAIREKAAAGPSQSEFNERMIKRIRQISTWLDLSPEEVQYWSGTAVSLYKYILHGPSTKGNFRPQFPRYVSNYFSGGKKK